MSGLRRGHPVGADQGPVQAGVRLLRRAQSLKDLGKVRGPVGDHPQGLMQIPVGRGPAHLRVAGRGGQGGARHHPPQQKHRPGPGRWPPSATASCHGPCGGRPTTGRWRGRWTREHPKWQDRTPARGPPGSGFIGQNTLSRAAPARTTPAPAQSLPHHRADPRQSGGFPGEKGSMSAIDQGLGKVGGWWSDVRGCRRVGAGAARPRRDDGQCLNQPRRRGVAPPCHHRPRPPCRAGP